MPDRINMMPRIQLTLLGAFQLRVEEQPVTGFRSDKARALLAYVAAGPEKAHDRTALAALLWPDMGNKAARTNLRNVLSNLRKLLPAGLSITRRAVLLDPNVIDVDLLRFRASVKSDPAGAVRLVQGDFLHGLTLPDAAPFTEWRTIEQERVHQQLMQALTALQAQAQERGAWNELAQYAGQQLALVPWHEPAHRAMMRALAGVGDHAGAMARYEQARAVLRDEMGLEPAAETKALLAELTASMPAVTNLPLLPEPLIGRDAEETALADMIKRGRLVTLLGPGGIGKSRLAQTVGRRLLPDFDDGVWLVSLAGVQEADGLYGAIGAALEVEFQGSASLREQLGVALASEERLLILDNFEHLASVGEGLLALLEAAPRLRLLVTSRVRLSLPVERTLLLGGLTPDAGLALFERRAQGVVPGFKLSTEDCQAVDRICRMVDGLPLGIELAAIWIEHFSCSEIADSIALTRTFLDGSTREKRAGDDRHYSLGAVFEHSWRLLTEGEQRALAQLSIFRSEFGRDAVLAITDAGLADLSALLSKSLLRRSRAGRYNLHEVIREFGAEKALEWPHELGTDGIAPAYRRYYLTAVQWGFADAASLRLDMDNIRAAWLDAVAVDDQPQLNAAAEGIADLMRGLGRLGEGAALFEEALAHATGEVAASLTVQLCPFYSSLFGSERVIALAEPALQLTVDPHLLAKLHGLLGREIASTGSWPEAEAHYELQEFAARRTGDKRLLALALIEHAEDQVLQFTGDFRDAIRRMETALELLRDEPGIEKTRTICLKGLSTAHLRFGNYAEAIRYAQLLLESLGGQEHQFMEINARLGLGLAQFFAGLHPQAIASTEMALQLAEDAGDREGVGLLWANFCLYCRCAGDLPGSRTYGELAIPLLHELGIRRMEGQARNRLAHTLAALEDWPGADAMYAAALETWRGLDNPNSYEAVAGRAVTALRLGREAEAHQLAEEALAFAQGDDALLRVVEPVLMLLNCEIVLRAAGEEQRAWAVLEQAKAWIDTISARNNDEAIREAYRNKAPAHRQLWEQIGANPSDAAEQ